MSAEIASTSSSPASVSSALQPERRRNPLTGDWVLVSPQRIQRPWQGMLETTQLTRRDAYVADCPLCPGNTRVNGARNPNYASTFVFNNDHAALIAKPITPNSSHTAEDLAKVALTDEKQALFQSQPSAGFCKVICYAPEHHLSMAELSRTAIAQVIDTWCVESAQLGSSYPWVQVFENKGEMMGCSQPHPHGQIWACDYLPSIVQSEADYQEAYFKQHGRPLLLDLAEQEVANSQEENSRVVWLNKSWLIIVPYWASWPFETLLLPRFAVQRLDQLSTEQREDLSEALSVLCIKYDNLFSCDFPYSMGWHGAPYLEDPSPAWQLHAHFYPPLLRSATIRKFMVGFELLAESQRDLSPERAAQILAAQATQHYRSKAT